MYSLTIFTTIGNMPFKHLSQNLLHQKHFYSHFYFLCLKCFPQATETLQRGQPWARCHLLISILKDVLDILEVWLCWPANQGGHYIVRAGWNSPYVHLHGQHRQYPRHLLQVHLLKDVQVWYLFTFHTFVETLDLEVEHIFSNFRSRIWYFGTLEVECVDTFFKALWRSVR